MFRIGFVQRVTASAVRSLATVPRMVSPLTSGLRMENSISTTLTKLQALHQPFITSPKSMPMIDPVKRPETINGLTEDGEGEADNTLYMDSVLRKRRLKMKKHKLRKRRRLQRSLKKRLGKI
ncbi:hypothetical protein JCM33374_g5869 [Metschnikowia sp. JCM 33374]|nr:hypothetical protein JCM33374_g5869 [Metschnikowia sp. JCM 33374]